jgi:hypothetical protein
MIRHFIAAAVFMSAAAFAPSLAQASSSAQLMAGDPSGRNVTFSFGAERGVAGLRIETHRVGDPGAKLSIWIDHARRQLFSRILIAHDCKFGDDGAQCRLFFPRTSPDYSRFLVAFKRGRTAHVEVENAAVMQMSTDISLAGFTRQLESRSRPAPR